jgi:hypothetical protein
MAGRQSSSHNRSTAKYFESNGLNGWLAALLVAPYYVFLITNGTFNLFFSPQVSFVSGYIFNSMLVHLLQGDFAVDADSIKLEAVVRNGQAYTYFRRRSRRSSVCPCCCSAP